MDEAYFARTYERLGDALSKPLAEKTTSFRSYSVAEIETALESRPIKLTERGRAYGYVISPQHYEMIMRMVCRKIDIEKHFEKNDDIISARLLQELKAVAPEKAANLFSVFFAHDDLKDEAAVHYAALDDIAKEPDTPEDLAQLIGLTQAFFTSVIDRKHEASVRLLNSVSDDIRKLAIMRQENPERASSALQVVEAIIAAADRDSPQKGDDCDSTKLPNQPSEGPLCQGVLP
ncbi:hypothetical protein [Asticcacaulis sp. W401b]|uniref:hypothetical protein n=1 Tax=Asticcacaulis sp. W401b TaxID=3388666 RepID=UPI003970A941